MIRPAPSSTLFLYTTLFRSVCEVLQASWTQSYPANTTCSTASGVAAGGHAVIVTSSGTFANRNFGNYTTGTVSGIKFEDPNGDGNLDNTRVTSSGSPWTITVFSLTTK